MVLFSCRSLSARGFLETGRVWRHIGDARLKFRSNNSSIVSSSCCITRHGANILITGSDGSSYSLRISHTSSRVNGVHMLRFDGATFAVAVSINYSRPRKLSPPDPASKALPSPVRSLRALRSYHDQFFADSHPVRISACTSAPK